MGFLLGAFGKLAAGSRYRSLQARMMRIQSKLRLASKQTANMEKQLETQKKLYLNKISTTSAMATFGINQAALNSGFDQSIIDLYNGGSTSSTTINEDTRSKLGELNSFMTEYKAMNEMTTANAKQRIENYFDAMKEMMLEPLKQEEESLQLEKDSLESQIQIAKADYDACKEMEKDGAKDMKPQYTAQG